MTERTPHVAGSKLDFGRDDRVSRLPDGSLMVYLHAGQLHASSEPLKITTILGSCVAIGLWDPVARIGGMNHYMLGDDIGSNPATPRHATFAIHELMARLQTLGANRLHLLAKIFGGASVIHSLKAAGSLGARNIAVGRARLQEAQIPIVAEDVGASYGRKVTFSTDSGLTLIKRL